MYSDVKTAHEKIVTLSTISNLLEIYEIIIIPLGKHTYHHTRITNPSILIMTKIELFYLDKSINAIFNLSYFIVSQAASVGVSQQYYQNNYYRQAQQSHIHPSKRNSSIGIIGLFNDFVVRCFSYNS